MTGHLWRVGTRLQAETNRLVAERGLSSQVACVGLAPWSGIRFTDRAGKDCLLLRSLFQQEALKRGLLTHGNHMLSLSHTDAIINETLGIYGEVLTVLAEAVQADKVAERLEGPPMQSVIRHV